ncbi:(Fe-S)-binding protein [Microlunatus soli]|uniref:Fe-S oxidoreductase n=1 Tax=Microlunatus soli TaxID=630515 RepID=A0A1H1VF84_9ACTN|nr:(Fe-S)-binding protein [Microlunatus soli]SDS83454.1 Fe-S oxidoreductase [Microlunatus soli]
MRILAIVLSLAASVVGFGLFSYGITRIVAVLRTGRSLDGRRRDEPGKRWAHLLTETILHTRMLQWKPIGIAHWFVFVAFAALLFSLATAYGQVFDPAFALPIIGHWVVYEWLSEIIAWLSLLGIIFLIIYRQVNLRRGRSSRFFGSNLGQAYYIEATVLSVVVCVLLLRACEFQLLGEETSVWHFPLTNFLLPAGLSYDGLAMAITIIATIKILISMLMLSIFGLTITMGVGWHRFVAWFNIWFKRESSGKPALGALQPIMINGAPLDFEQLEDIDDDTPLGVGKVEDFTWKGLLDFTTCTECGRCQSQCPAWNTEKPLSPKLLITGLRDHSYAKAPYLQAAEEARGGLATAVQEEAQRPLVGPIQVEEGFAGIVDPDVLWSCTSCGACVQQCPVDIEHVDHIMDMRRYQVMIDSEFPTELNGLFKGLEKKGNPWNMSARKRLEWAKELEFEVPVVGEDVEDLTGTEYLFWVGCAGAYEDRAKKTTQAVAELLHTAGVSFAVLGNGETCTGDPARRAGNEFVFQQLAMENAETLREAKAHKVLVTCAHCLNTLKNEYPQVGVDLEVVHHTQLLNRLVREGKLTPVAPPAGEVAGRTITYHDPCYLGRHNQVYDPPRELLGAIPGTTYAEMPRNRERSFCCGAGGARMWMEEKIGTRINLNRTDEALTALNSQLTIADSGSTAATNGHAPADATPGAAAGGNGAIATGCPFCRVMLSDGLTARQSEGRAAESVEVLDVAQLLLESVHRSKGPEPAEGS